MNVLATLLGGSALVGGTVLLAVKTSQKAGERVEAPVGSKLRLTFYSSRPLSTNDVGAILWSFEDYFPGTVEGIGTTEPTCLVMNVVSMSPAAFEIGAVGVFADIVLQLVEVKIVEGPPEQAPMPEGTVIA